MKKAAVHRSIVQMKAATAKGFLTETLCHPGQLISISLHEPDVSPLSTVNMHEIASDIAFAIFQIV
jgi:hypothetical protein